MGLYNACELCPRRCKVDREYGEKGVCGVDASIKVSRAALHFWEETCISGTKGSGTVFFSGCNLHCVFCQNQAISDGRNGKIISRERLAEIYLELQEKGANNINLVTGTHYVPDIVWSVEKARKDGLIIPIVYNTSAYENVDTIKMLEGIVDVYLPDFKYYSEDLSKKYSHAMDYRKAAKLAIQEMVRQQPVPEFYKEANSDVELMRKGVIVRQLLLPGQLSDAKKIVSYLHRTYGEQIYVSLMSQYTPLPHIKDYPELNRSVDKRTYERYIDYAIAIGITNGFVQEGDVAKESFIPSFDNEGV